MYGAYLVATSPRCTPEMRRELLNQAKSWPAKGKRHWAQFRAWYLLGEYSLYHISGAKRIWVMSLTQEVK